VIGDYLGFLLNGLGTGAVVALLAVGLLLTQRASNVVNFAHAALGMYVALTYFELRETGDLVLPVLGLPARVHVVDTPTVATAMTVAVVLSALLGLVLHFGVFRWLRTSPALARVVASLGLLLYFVAIVKLRFVEIGGSLPLGNLLPVGSVRVAGAVVPLNRILLALLALGVAAVLAAVFRWTRFGLATRAAAENETAAVLSGHSPDRLAAANWVIASVLAGVAVILIASVTKQLDPLSTSMLVVPALAAMLLGGLRSFMLTTAAGLAIGMLQSGVLNYSTRAEWLPGWLPQSGLVQTVPFVLLVVALTVQGQRLPGRAVINETSLPASPSPRHVGVIAVGSLVVLVVALMTVDSQWRLAIVVSMIAAVIALSSVVLTGWVGQISLAQLAFAGLAGFTTAKLTVAAGIPFPWAPLLAVLLTTVVGVLVGLPAVRVRGMTLAIVTLGAAVAIEQLVFASSALGGLGRQQLPRPRLFGIDLGISARGADNFRPAYGILVAVVLVAVFVASANLRRSPTGLQWLAVRANERAAAASGIDVRTAKLSAFAVSSAIAGIGGVLLGYRGSLAPESFAVFGALALLALTYLGGVASMTGAVIAGVLFSGGVLTQLSGGSTGTQSDLAFALSGLSLVAVSILYRDGIAGALRKWWARLVGGSRGRTPAPVEGSESSGGTAGSDAVAARAAASVESTPAAPGVDLRPPEGTSPVTAHGHGPPVDASPAPLLVVEGLTVSYGGVQAVSEVDLVVPEATIVGLIGPNGAGKTTCIDALSGFAPAGARRLELAGVDLRGRPAHDRARRGLVRTFQSVELFDDLTVAENLQVAALDTRWWSPVVHAVHPGRRRVDLDWALAVVGLDDAGGCMPGELSLGRRRMAGIARALVSRPRLVLLDEPAAGLDTFESEALARRLSELPAMGVSVLLVDHDMSLVHEICREITVLDFGHVIATGPPAEVTANRAVIDAYLGQGQPA
jgi:ABC-type branched-subunit amino acid transport system ATPase component/branched-subunit amino acid ABC-type transport system permease component